ncbi:MAG: hypothetical protein JO249_16420 [Acidobacteria bacterium]|nr:hypothetical protein [Acidobacteriota bacterium]
MRVLLRRRITQPTGSIRFALWARFEVSAEELALIDRYHTRSSYITIEASRRDFYRAGAIGFVIALVITGLMVAMFANAQRMNINGLNSQPADIPVWVALLLFFSLFLIVTWAIYEQLRLAIRISDMLDGREFKHKSLVLMARRERQVIGYGVAFLHFLEKLQDWEGTEVITLGEEHEPALRLVTDTYAPA